MDKVSIPKIVNVRLKNGGFPVIVPQINPETEPVRKALLDAVTELEIARYDSYSIIMYDSAERRTYTTVLFKTDKDFVECLEIAKYRGLSS
jgi:hypothetical protein